MDITSLGSASGLEELMVAVMGVLGIAMLIMLPLLIFAIVCNVKIFKKMGAPGWAAIIPFYNTWVMYEKVWGNVTMPIAALALSAISFFVSGIVAFFVTVASAILAIFTICKQCKKFGKGAGFCVLYILLPIVAMPILAFGSAEFDGNTIVDAE